MRVRRLLTTKIIISIIILFLLGLFIFRAFFSPATFHSVMRIAEKNNEFVDMPIKDVLSMIQHSKYETYPIDSSYYIGSIEPIISNTGDLSGSNDVCVVTWNSRDKGGKYIFYLSKDNIVQRFVPVILWD